MPAKGSMQYVRSRYRVPAKRGMTVRYTGDASGEIMLGRITSASNGRIMIRFEGKFFGKRSVPAHPTWKIEYLDHDGNMIHYKKLLQKL